MNWQLMSEFAHGASHWQTFWMAFSGFGLIYFGMAAVAHVFSRVLCPRWGVGTVLDKRPLFEGQILWEIRHSLLSIAIFALYGVLTMEAEKRVWVRIDWEWPRLARLGLDLLILVLWNEIHFYAIHRSLHTKWLYRKVHWVHHRSTTNTPFATYSFHWVESTALSSVMILAMPFHDFNITALLLFPLVSLTMNAIGHLNFTIFADKPMNHVASASRRHAAHHRYYGGNFGFLLPYLDRWFATSLPQRSR